METLKFLSATPRATHEMSTILAALNEPRYADHTNDNQVARRSRHVQDSCPRCAVQPYAAQTLFAPRSDNTTPIGTAATRPGRENGSGRDSERDEHPRGLRREPRRSSLG